MRGHGFFYFFVFGFSWYVNQNILACIIYKYFFYGRLLFILKIENWACRMSIRLRIHFRGIWVNEPNLRYINSKVIDEIFDPDYFSLIDVTQIIKDISYRNILGFYSKLLGQPMEMVKPLSIDDELLEVINEARHSRGVS